LLTEFIEKPLHTIHCKGLKPSQESFTSSGKLKSEYTLDYTKSATLTGIRLARITQRNINQDFISF